MRTISELRLHNFKCYRGEQALILEPKSYAVVAKHKSDAERSNWLGKSTLPTAVDYALYGEHGMLLEDDWITEGESQGGVALVLDDGHVIRRERHLGKSTRLSVDKGGFHATGEAAQQFIEQSIGLTHRDFINTGYIQQRQMARFILDSGQRMKTITSWLRLEPLIEAEDKHRVIAAAISLEIDKLSKEIAIAKANEEQASTGLDDDGIIAGIKAMTVTVDGLEDEVAELHRQVQACAELDNARSCIAKYDQLIDAGKTLRKEVDAKLPEKRKEVYEKFLAKDREAASQVEVTRLELQQKSKLARGAFDGICPVAHMPCPAKDEINARVTKNEALHQKAKNEYEAAYNERRKTEEKSKAALAEVQEIDRDEGRLERMRREVASLAPDYKRAKKMDLDEADSLPELRQKLQAKNQEHAVAIAKLRGLVQNKKRVAEARILQKGLRAQIIELEKKIAIEREAIVVFGKNGAQRRVAEIALSDIEEGANGMLSECGIDLRLAVRWSREGGDLASVCDSCGHPFPKTARCKKCERCDAPRGLNVINKLDVVVSNVSGGANDLAGVALQLSASAWLRRDRNSRWSTILVDEPFGQLDASNRRALTTHFASLLRSRYGFEQAFIIAHHTSVLDTLPGRIEIVSDGRHASARVAA